jgi:transposase
MTKTGLPNDIDTLKDIAIRLHQRNQQLERQIEHLLRKRHHLNGPADASQLALFEGGSTAPPAAPPADEAPEAQPRGRGAGHGRRHRDLRRVRRVHELPAGELNCPCCDQPRVQIGEEVSEQIEYQPAEFYIIEHVRPKYACKHCEGQVVVADKPSQPIEKGLAGPGLLAFVATSKYCDHQPLHRLERIMARSGLHVSRSTMCDWMAASAALLGRLYECMKQEILASKVLHTDDTGLPVLDPPMSQTKNGHLWVYLGDREHPYTVFDYTATHEATGLESFLQSFRGYLQADA